jgi:hypothetical protein
MGTGDDTLTGSAGHDHLIDDTGADVHSFSGSFGAITGSGAHKTSATSRRHLPLLSIGNWPATARQVLL